MAQPTPLTTDMIPLSEIIKAQQRVKDVIVETPFVENINLSHKYGCEILLKREDMQVVRSFKIRGAYNKISGLTPAQTENGVICASAGNHAQGVAFACAKLKIKGKIYMPNPTPAQKINKVKLFGQDWVEIILVGDTYDDAHAAALTASEANAITFVHPFDDPAVIAGQGTIAVEILKQSTEPLDYLLVAVGGGGLISGVGSYFKAVSPSTQIIAVEASGAAALDQSLTQGKRVRLEQIETFADGIAVKQIGALTYEICKEVVDENMNQQEQSPSQPSINSKIRSKARGWVSSSAVVTMMSIVPKRSQNEPFSTKERSITLSLDFHSDLEP